MRNHVNRLIVELAVSKAIKEIAKGSMPRALHSLVDEGGLLASAVPPDLSPLVQSMLRNEQHPYYTVAQRLVAQVDKRYLQGFLVNLGFEGLSCFGSQLLSQHAETGHWLPWIMGLPLPLPRPDSLRIPLSLGIQAYVLTPENAPAAELSALCRAYPRTAFLAALPDRDISPELLHALEGTDNLAILPVSRYRPLASAPTLRHARRFFLPLFFLDTEETERLMETGNLRCPEDPDCPMALFLPDSSVPKETADAFAARVIRARLEPGAPLLPGCPSMDIRGIEQALAGDPDASFSLPEGYDFSPFLLPGRDLARRLESMAQ